MKHLVVAEKPSVGRDIARVLHCAENNHGFISGNDYIVTWAVGHLVANMEPDEIDSKYAEWKLEDLPILPSPLPLKVLPDTKTQFDLIAALMNSEEVDQIICATDAGREGELIFRYIYHLAECHKTVQRLWISSMTPQAIREGFRNLRPSEEYDALYWSALCRSDADWLIGMNGSRAFSVCHDAPLSVGRVQSPTLAILVEREMQRRSFIPEEYWTLTAEFGGYKGIWFDPTAENESAHWIREDRIDAMKRFADQLPGQQYTVKEYTAEKKAIPSPRLFDLTSLQREANRRFGYSAKKTLKITQSLYEKRKAVTYPRTDSRCLSHDMANTLKRRLEKLSRPEWSSCVAEAMVSDKNLFGRFINDAGVSDHHAIIPTGYSCGEADWTDGENNIFDLIARRYIAMFLPDLEVEDQNAITETGGQLFRTAGRKVLSAGWEKISPSNEETSAVPELTPGSSGVVRSIDLEKRETQPPPPHTDASLLYAMEHAGERSPISDQRENEIHVGLGTPATRADMIEKLIDKYYAKRRGKALFPTEDGMKLVEVLPEYLSSPDMTAAWEQELAGICSGEKAPDAFMEEIRKLTKDIVEYAPKTRDIEFGVGICPLCGSRVFEGAKDYFCWEKGCTFHVWKAAKGQHPTIWPDMMRLLLQNEKVETDRGSFWLIKEEPFVRYEAHAPTVAPGTKIADVKEILKQKGIEPVDKTGSGGAFWIPGGNELEPLIQLFKEMGVQFFYAEASKALKHKPGWWYKL